MVFSSFFFLFGFLPLCIFSFFIVPKKLKNLTLLFWSLCFYAWGTFSFFPIFIISCLFDYFIAIKISDAKSSSSKKKLLFFAISLNLLLLVYYKYTNFLVYNFNNILAYFNFEKIKFTSIILPIGISFITFQKISYLVDVYRETNSISSEKKFTNYLLYISLFPQLIAGPIVRYKDIVEQISNRTFGTDNLINGLYRFCIGLAKKIFLADAMGNVVANIEMLGENSITTPYAWLGTICYYFQIYFDFSGYSDMAIGLGRVFGFTFLENFNKPFISQSFSEFWQRWHISLSRFMKDYVYIPLGGNRVSVKRSYLNLWIVFLLSGVWHGANWTYIIWGAFNGLFLTIDKLWWIEKSKKIATHPFGKFFNFLVTFFFLQIGWALFMAKDITSAFKYIGYMFNPKYLTSNVYPIWGKIIHNEGIFIFIICSLIFLLPLFPFYEKTSEKMRENAIFKSFYFKFAFCVIVLFLSCVVLSASKFSPFIYFQF